MRRRVRARFPEAAAWRTFTVGRSGLNNSCHKKKKKHVNQPNMNDLKQKSGPSLCIKTNTLPHSKGGPGGTSASTAV
jgi:hypothetical protein